MKHLPLAISLLLLTSMIYLFSSAEVSPLGAKLRQVDKLLIEAELKRDEGQVKEGFEAIAKAGKILKEMKDRNKSHFFYLLKARYSLVENERPKEKGGISPSDQRGLTYVRQAQQLIPEDTKPLDRNLLIKEMGLLEARFLLRMQDTLQALPLLQKIWEMDKKMRHTAFMLSETYFKLASFEEKKAEKHLIEALSYADKSIELSKIERKRRKKDGSEEAYMVFQFPSGFNQRARVRMRQGAYLDALLDLDQALKQKPGFTVARFNRGVCLGMLSSTHERDKDPKKYEDYRTELMREIIALRRSSPRDADELFRRFYNKSFR
jgi:tetratricopeptide (TPR) repeat protein